MNQKRSYGGLDWFRVISAVLVITIHTSPLLCFGEVPDMILTRIIARVAVPFFLMISGFFLLPELRWNEDSQARIFRQVKKLLLLDLAASLLYVPVMIYSGYFGEGFRVVQLIKDILINGTFYHLWYLPAAIFGLLLVNLLLKHCRDWVVLAISICLYLIGLFGDSYYGAVAAIPWISTAYSKLFQVSEYTRNGLFYVPLFLVLGYLIGKTAHKKWLSVQKAGIGFLCSMLLMLAEGITIHFLNWQRHDSMYVMLPIVMIFLFLWVVQWKGGGSRRWNRIAMIVYIIHPAVIVAVRLAGKVTGTTWLVTEQSLVHFLLVTVISVLIAYGLTMIRFRGRKKQNTEPHKRAWTEISIENLYHNVNEIQKLLPPQTKFMAVVKANGYGSGDIRIAGNLNKMGIDAFAVATLDEGIHLRKNGITGMILILGYTEPERIGEIERYHLTQTITDYDYATRLDAYGKKIAVHIKLDTGMHRLGEDYHDMEHIRSMYQLRHLQVEGIYTHLCVADSMEPDDIAFTHQQIRHYYDVLEYLKGKGIHPGKTHIQSSYGVLNYPELRCDYARIGIAMYGVLSNLDSVKTPVDLRPVLTVKSKVISIRQIKAGEAVGYGRAYVATKDACVAVVAIGYADGIPRELSCGKGVVLVHGEEAQIIGRICMDQMMIDITGIRRVQIGDVVTVIGSDMEEDISAEKVAIESDTITNELLSRLGERLERVYL